MNAEETRSQLLQSTMQRTLQKMDKQASQEEVADIDRDAAAKIAKLAYAKGQEDMAKLAYTLGVQDATTELLRKLAMEGGDALESGPTMPAYTMNKDQALMTRQGLEEVASSTPGTAVINKNDDLISSEAGGGSAPPSMSGEEKEASFREADAMLDELLKQAMDEEEGGAPAGGGAATAEGQGIPGPPPSAPMPQTQADVAENQEPPGRTRTAPRASEATFASFVQAMTTGQPEAS